MSISAGSDDLSHLWPHYAKPRGRFLDFWEVEDEDEWYERRLDEYQEQKDMEEGRKNLFGMNQGELGELRRVFSLYALASDETFGEAIPLTEVEDVLRELGVHVTDTDSFLEMVEQDIDDGSGALDFEEFCLLWSLIGDNWGQMGRSEADEGPQEIGTEE